MPTLLINDFLQTQGLKLPHDDISSAYAAAQAVMHMGKASIERHLLWPQNEHFRLADHIAETPDHEALLKQIFMALDSVYSRQNGIRSAALYAHMPSESGASELVLLTRQGVGAEPLLPVDEACGRSHLASRTAQSGWMNIAHDTAAWLAAGELEGERNAGSAAQVSIPVCSAGGAVLGVLHLESEHRGMPDDAGLAEWTGLSLALIEPLKTLLNVTDEEQHD